MGHIYITPSEGFNRNTAPKNMFCMGLKQHIRIYFLLIYNNNNMVHIFLFRIINTHIVFLEYNAFGQ